MFAPSSAVPGLNSGEADFSVIAFPGQAGGILANVNRWRDQLGLAPIDEETLAEESKTVRLRALGGEISVFDLVSKSGAPRGTVGAILTTADKTWFFKLTGPADPVRAGKREFIEFLKSLRTDNAGS